MATQKKRGRKPQADSKSGRIRELLKTGAKPMDIAKQVGCTPALVYNVRSSMGGSAKRASKQAPSASVSGGDLGDLVAAVRRVEADRARMQRALEQIQTVIRDVLA